MVVRKARQTARTQPFQHLWDHTTIDNQHQTSCLHNGQYVNTYILYQTNVECRSNKSNSNNNKEPHKHNWGNYKQCWSERHVKQQEHNHSNTCGITTPLTTNIKRPISTIYINTYRLYQSSIECRSNKSNDNNNKGTHKDNWGNYKQCWLESHVKQQEHNHSNTCDITTPLTTNIKRPVSTMDNT